MAKEWLQNSYGRMKATLGLQDEEAAQQEQTLLGRLNEAATLDRTTRMLGFLICIAIGMLFSFMSTMFLLRPTKFAVLYTLGSVLSVCSTMFLMGPFAQIKRMFESKRVVFTLVYLTSMALTLFSALWLHSMIAALLCIVIQFAAFIMYSLTYIPFGQAILKRMLPWATWLDEGTG